jgi:hypothetical protein
MEQSAAPMPLNAMMTNIENNGAPWQYNQQDRLNWKDENSSQNRNLKRVSCKAIITDKN